VREGFQIDRTSTADQAAAALRERILGGELPPGTALQEVSVAEALGISRNTLREAIRSLVHEGLVKHTPHRGASVMSLGRQDVSDIFLVRKLLEPTAVRKALDLPAEDVRELRELVEAVNRAVDDEDWPLAVELDMRFHRRLVSQHGSERIDGLFRTVTAELRLALILIDRQVSAAATARQMARHGVVVDLLEKGRVEQCAEEILDHLEQGESRVMDAIASSPSLDFASGS
jgi:DNA-binding GntR family transcriptional regulator